MDLDTEIKHYGTRKNDGSYKRASAFDKNGYAVISEYTKNIYVINLKGEKVSGNYSTKGTAEKIYIVIEKDNRYTISD